MQRRYRELDEELNLAEEFMYELVPKALNYYFNLENISVPESKVKEIPKSDDEEGISEEEDEEYEEDNEEDISKPTTKPIIKAEKDKQTIRPICLLQ